MSFVLQRNFSTCILTHMRKSTEFYKDDKSYNSQCDQNVSRFTLRSTNLVRILEARSMLWYTCYPRQKICQTIRILIITIISLFKKLRNFQESQPLEHHNQEALEINRPKTSANNSMTIEGSLYRTISNIHEKYFPKTLK